MGHSVRVRWVIGLVLVVGVAVSGCVDGAGEREVVVVVERFLGAVGVGDAVTACGLLTPMVREGLAVVEGARCELSLPVERLGGGPVSGVEVWSGWARVSTGPGVVFLTEFGSGWLVSAAGCRPRGEASYRCVVGG